MKRPIIIIMIALSNASLLVMAGYRIVTPTCCGSMSPTINDHEPVLIAPYHGGNVTGLIVVYNASWHHTFVMHRVTWENETHFQAKGDATIITDPIENKERILFFAVFNVYRMAIL
jgi:hypothetical protein